MKLSDIKDVSAAQKSALELQGPGLERRVLPDLPDIRSHALAVNGIRRCGKSTLLRQFVRRLKRPYFYMNFDDMRLVSFSAADYGLVDAAVAASGARLIFFDEVQSAESWELYVRQKLDEGFQVVLTGSNASLLSRELGARLTGRHISKELFPFSYGEFCRFVRLRAGAKSFLRYLDTGGFPEYLKTGNADILTQLLSDILYRDIAVRYGIRDAASLRRLFVYLASNPSHLFSPSKLTGVAGVKSPATVLEYISFFEAAYLIQIVPRFAYSVKAQNLAPKKTYVIDPGIIRTSSVSLRESDGALLENFVFNSLRASAGAAASRAERDIYYFAGKNGGECDFIVSPSGGKPACVQVCWELNAENQDREISGLTEALNFFDRKSGTIITFDREDTINAAGKRLAVVPAWKWGAGF
jgi:predicted AAA+ superfamily ATPase